MLAIDSHCSERPNMIEDQNSVEPDRTSPSLELAEGGGELLKNTWAPSPWFLRKLRLQHLRGSLALPRAKL